MKRKESAMKRVSAALVAFVAGLAMAGCAQAADEKNRSEASKMMPVPPSPVSPSEMTMARGEVTKIDKVAGKITVKHGPLISLRMAAATTDFRVKDPAMLNLVKEGDRINFSVDKVNGAIFVTQLELAK